MSQPSSTEPRRYLIAIGSPDCPGLKLPSLGRVESDIRDITDLFEKQGYQRVLSDQIDLGSTALVIKQAMVDWFASPDRKASDYVVVYYGGHGDEGGRFGEHYLFTVESIPTKPQTRAIATKEFVSSFFPIDQNTSPQNVLLILDTCYAHAGGRQISAVLSDLKGAAPEGSGFWVISSSNSNTEAGDGAFVEALCAVMQPDYEGFQQNGEFISIDVLVGQINQHFIVTRQAQRAIADGRGFQQQATFIRNPRRLRTDGSNTQGIQRQEQRSAQLIDCLWSLDYKLQSRLFEDYTPPSRLFAAFVIQAKHNLIQRWLVKRLFKECLDVGSCRIYPFELPHRLSKQKIFNWTNLFWDGLITAFDPNIKLETLADKKSFVLEKLVEENVTKTIIITIYGWQDLPLSQDLQRQILADLWKPLVEKIQNSTSQPRKRLILFLTGEGTNPPDLSDDISSPIRLASAEITSQAVVDWLYKPKVFSALSKLENENEIEELIKFIADQGDSWDSDPHTAIDEIFKLFDFHGGILDISEEIASEWRLAG